MIGSKRPLRKNPDGKRNRFPTKCLWLIVMMPLALNSSAWAGCEDSLFGREESPEFARILEQALPIAERQLREAKEQSGSDSLESSAALNSLAMINGGLNRYAEAERLMKSALTIAIRQFGPYDYIMPTLFFNLSDLYCDQGKYVEAEVIMKRGLFAAQKNEGLGSSHLTDKFETYAALLRKIGRKVEAVKIEARAKTLRAVPAGPPLWQALAEQNDPIGQLELGNMYRKGKEIPQDLAKAMKWYRQAAEQELEIAQFFVGLMYYFGDGVARDRREAFTWFQRAADHGFAMAQWDVGLMYRDGKGIKQNYGEAARWFRLAAEQGLAKAQISLGILYAEGQGMPQDQVQAYAWFQLAAMQVHKPASELRDHLSKTMKPAQITEAKRLVQEWKPRFPGFPKD